MTKNKAETAKLITDPNIENPDKFYEKLIAAHRDLDEDQSAALNSRLILILANHIGDISVLNHAIDTAADPEFTIK